MPKTISKKTIGKTTYELKLFEGDNKYVIYKKDRKKTLPFHVTKIPEVAVFDNKEEAVKFFEELS